MLSKFTIEKNDRKTAARTGEIRTSHGTIKTPCFIPDATYGTVKHLSSGELSQIPLPLVLGNIYHLWLRPGIALIKKMGGLHRFMNWPKPIITDSGGFQVFSLVYKNKMGKIYPTGVEFRDHLTGKKHFLTPQKSIALQLDVDSDIIMVLDFPILPHAKTKDADNIKSVELTGKWAKIGKKYFDSRKESKGKIIMGIVQGAGSQVLRQKSYQELCTLNFDGYAFGGLPLDYKILAYTASLIPENKIRYVMGSGTPVDILREVAMGWNLFDCVIPTRNARHGLLYTFNGELRITQEKYQKDQKVIEKDCSCLACQEGYSRSYLRHLFKVKEPLASRLFTLHNLTFYAKLMQEIRESIENRKFKTFAGNLLKKYRTSNWR